jgi:hypothetical protein
MGPPSTKLLAFGVPASYLPGDQPTVFFEGPPNHIHRLFGVSRTFRSVLRTAAPSFGRTNQCVHGVTTRLPLYLTGRPRSSVDRVPASGAGSEGSNPSGGTTRLSVDEGSLDGSPKRKNRLCIAHAIRLDAPPLVLRVTLR